MRVKGTNNKKNMNMRYWTDAGLVFMIFLVAFTLTRLDRREKTVYDVVIFGDSLMGLCRDETSVSGRLEEMTGQSVYNAALGGTCLAVQDQDLDANYTMSLLNMVSLSKAIESDDFGVQETVRSKREIMYYFTDVIDELPLIDWGQVKTVILAYGLNDYHAGIPTDNDRNAYDENTYGGAMRSTLSVMQKVCPDARFLIVTPTYTWYVSNGLTCEEYVTGEAFLEEYVQKAVEIAVEFGVPVVDLYHDGYAHEQWEDWESFTIDGIHPNEEARRMIAEKIAEGLE